MVYVRYFQQHDPTPTEGHIDPNLPDPPMEARVEGSRDGGETLTAEDKSSSI